MVQDPTVSVDGRDLWRQGRLNVYAFEPLQREAEKWPVLVELFANPSDEVGIFA